MVETEYKKEGKSRILLIAAILLAIAVFIWVILYFDDQPGERNGIGQSRLQKIMVVNSPDFKIKDFTFEDKSTSLNFINNSF